MSRQNRVTPFGEIIATAQRGTFMGNRGVLHDSEGRIRREHALKRWIICVLEFRGRRRQVMTPGRYTELFFLDEATALAAGHRPCAECRRVRFNDFRSAWSNARPAADDIDEQLLHERLTSDHTAALEDLPDGVFVTVPSWGGETWLVRGDEMLAWSPGGYRERRKRPDGTIRLLTPPSTVKAIRAGYVPEIHPSADRGNIGRGSGS